MPYHTYQHAIDVSWHIDECRHTTHINMPSYEWVFRESYHTYQCGILESYEWGICRVNESLSSRTTHIYVAYHTGQYTIDTWWHIDECSHTTQMNMADMNESFASLTKHINMPYHTYQHGIDVSWHIDECGHTTQMNMPSYEWVFRELTTHQYAMWMNFSRVNHIRAHIHIHMCKQSRKLTPTGRSRNDETPNGGRRQHQ